MKQFLCWYTITSTQTGKMGNFVETWHPQEQVFIHNFEKKKLKFTIEILLFFSIVLNIRSG